MEEVLRLRKVNKAFPGVKALTDVDFTLRKGEIHALVGENGAGKSTLVKVVSGAYKRDSGEIWLDGEELAQLTPKETEKRGVSIIYQELNLIERMTVAENVFIGRFPKKNGFLQWGKMYKDAQTLFDGFGLKINARAMVRSLTMAQKQMVEIVKAVSIKAKVIIMDEPTSSLSERETEALFRIIRELKVSGVAIVFITHRLDEVFAVCDRATVLRDGHYIGEADIKDIGKPQLIAMMIGRKLTRQYPQRQADIKEATLEVQELSDDKGHVKDVSFSSHKGEILGFYGLVGAGRTETMRMVFGADSKKTGRIFLAGKEICIKNPRDAIKNRIGFITENRRDEGLVSPFSVRMNIVMVALKKILKRGFISYRTEKKLAEQYIKRLKIATPSVNQKAMYLSGGNQQKLVLSKWLLPDSDILIFDEPTRGIDVGARREIYQIINDLADDDKTIIVVSSDMEEIIGISDRIIVMYEGRISGELKKEEFSQKLITQYAVGERNLVS